MGNNKKISEYEIVEIQEELKDLLDKKYMVTSIKGIDLILTRIKENLSLNSSE